MYPATLNFSCDLIQRGLISLQLVEISNYGIFLFLFLFLFPFLPSPFIHSFLLFHERSFFPSAAKDMEYFLQMWLACMIPHLISCSLPLGSKGGPGSSCCHLVVPILITAKDLHSVFHLVTPHLRTLIFLAL